MLTGEGTLGGRRVAMVVGEFGFLAGTIGSVAASRIAAERATAERLPLIGITASGGTRMQEGTPGFLSMAGIAAAIAEHKRSGLPYLTYLRHPTTDGVLASWGSLGHITLAEPEALVGFLGPKVYAALNGGQPFAEGVQRSEHLHKYGLIDAVVSAHHLRALLIRILALMENPPATPAGSRTVSEPVGPFPDAWTTIAATRDRARRDSGHC